MNRASRETVFAALFTILQSVPGVNSSSRQLKAVEDVQPEDMPAVFQMQGKQVITYKGLTPSLNDWNATWAIYVASSDPAVAPSTILNNIVEAALAKLAPPPGYEKQTLGGLVEYIGVVGDIETFDGMLGNKAVALIPLRIVLGGF